MSRSHEQILTVSHADVDFLGELKVSALLGVLEQTAVEASAAAGFDPARYAAEGRVWLVRRTRLERIAPAGGGDALSVSTRVADFRRARSLRLYDVRRTGGYGDRSAAVVARASTDWVYCDAATGRPVSVPEEMKAALFGPVAVPVLDRAARVEVPGDPAPGRLARRIRPSHLDHMAHVNNAVWADFLEDAGLSLFADEGFGVPEMLARGGALRIRSLDLEYLDDAHLDEAIEVRSWPAPGGDRAKGERVLVQAVHRSDGRRLLRARTSWAWRRRSPILGGSPSDPPGPTDPP